MPGDTFKDFQGMGPSQQEAVVDSLDVLMSDPAMESEEEKRNAWYNVFIQGLKKFRDQGLEVEKQSNIVTLSQKNPEDGSHKDYEYLSVHQWKTNKSFLRVTNRTDVI